MSIDHLYINLGDDEFSFGLTYVALTRIINALNLIIETLTADRYKRIFAHICWVDKLEIEEFLLMK